MPFAFEKVGLAGLVAVTPRIFTDDRGLFFESYKKSEFERAGFAHEFVQDNHSVSKRGVLRGLHYQLPPHAQGKLVRVVEGRAWDVAVDIRAESPTLGKWHAIELSDQAQNMFYLPPGFAHGFVALTERVHLLYKCTAEYRAESEAGIRWNDPTLAIAWPFDGLTICQRDRELPLFADAKLFAAGSAA